ncbi:probable metalloreductase Aim14p [[Candida] anglica]|uniref:Probable metalloreductase AIM14 n=1 Tax=[Candida] anglica TaxID=148631 RepID=A0ABP0EK54_9ASCO
MSDSSPLYARHAGHHHTINVKYGYFILLLSAIHAGIIFTSMYIYVKNWNKTGSVKRVSWLSSSSILPLLATVILWALILTGTSVWAIDWKDNYTVFIKRTGRLCVALIPFDMFLVIRSSGYSSSPTSGQFFNYLAHINLHKWISRLIILFSSIHSIGFIWKWIHEGVLYDKIFILLNSLGVIVWITSLILIIISLKYFRSRYYRYFYLWHNITVWGFVVLIGFHARPGISLYSFLCIMILFLQIYLRFSQQTTLEEVQIVKPNSNSGLYVVRINKLYVPPWSPGSHIRISESNSFKQYLYPSHPYTIASTIDDSTLDLVVRTSKRFQFHQGVKYNLSGPYTSLPDPFFSTAEQVVIICGGSGISFGLPLIKGLTLNSNAKVDLFWCIRTIGDLEILKILQVNENINVYITGVENDIYTEGGDEDTVSEGLLNNSEQTDHSTSFELDSLESEEEQINNANKFNPSTIINRGRPDFNMIFSSLIEGESKNNKWIVACGPRGLVHDARKWSDQNKVPFISEVYEM